MVARRSSRTPAAAIDSSTSSRTAEPRAGTLFVVATPIGNLEDITLRALRVLKEAAVVAAEDTRRTGNLLRHYGIQTPLVSVHAHNEPLRVDPMLTRLRGGESVALVSDAGTPGISDPGAILVRAAREAGIRVEPVPGASAVVTALSASGVSFERFAFAGFPPVRGKDRKLWFDWIVSLRDVPVACYEAPHRIDATLSELRHVLGDRQIIVARELTKAHEEWVFLSNTRTDAIQLTPSTAAGDFRTQIDAPWDVRERGEFVLIIAPQSSSGHGNPASPVSDDEIAALFGRMTVEGTAGSRRDVIRGVADRLGLTNKSVYDALERVKKINQT